MYEGMTGAEANLLLLQSMIPKDEPLYIWCFHENGRCIASSCPDPLRPPLEHALQALNDFTRVHDPEICRSLPRILGSSIGMQWGITLEEERKTSLIFVIGPVFYAPPDLKKLHTLPYAADTSWIPEVAGLGNGLPVMSHAVFSRYLLMVHNILTGQQLGMKALEPRISAPDGVHDSPAGTRNRMQIYQAEQALLQMVRDGEINYQKVLQTSISLSPGVPVQGRDPLRQMKTSLTVFITLVSRAAMEGGLSPEIAYSLGDSYIQTVENCRDSGELAAIGPAMYHDFIYRVHHVRSNPNYSHAIQKCCDYIELSLDRRIRTSDLAALVGYTEYYLTEKFRRETGKAISTYIRDARIARAKVILESTQLSVAEVADRLAFNTPNYFIQCFRSVTGCTPAQYRKRFRHE